MSTDARTAFPPVVETNPRANPREMSGDSGGDHWDYPFAREVPHEQIQED